MANTGASLVDRVVPDVPVRQFVLSIPYELRRLAAFDPGVLTALNRIFVEAVLADYRARARRSGDGDGQTGAVTLVQRFGNRRSWRASHTNKSFHGDRLRASL